MQIFYHSFLLVRKPRQGTQILTGALVYWLRKKTHVQEVVYSNLSFGG